MKDKNITYGDVERIVGYQGIWKLQPAQATDPKVMESVIARVIRAKIVADIARAKGFDKKADIKEELEMISNDLLAQEFLRTEILEKVEITDADVKSYYEANKENFRVPAMVKARHILISQNIPGKTPEEASQKAREKAEEAMKRVQAGEDFAKVATEMSDDTGTKASGGDLGFFPKGKMVKEFEDAAFLLNKGEVSDPVRTVFGFH
ncbi:MAG: peptidylprolyl isomerase, partial [Thermodesulfovibrionales bacterium]